MAPVTLRQTYVKHVGITLRYNDKNIADNHIVT
jgi:hypothetical protein